MTFPPHHFCRSSAEQLTRCRPWIRTLVVACSGDVEISSGTAHGLQWSATSTGRDVTVALAGEIDLANAGALAEALAQVIEAKPPAVIIDLTQLSFLDSSGIRCLVIAAREASAVGSHVIVRRPSPTILRTLEICGVDELLMRSPNENPAPRR
jgi:anti-anti-sigma factor